jgi:hypothetical protein
MEKYNRFSILSVHRKNPLSRWCPKCEAVYVADFDLKETPQIQCRECGVMFCFNCNIVWHDGKTCREIQDEKTPEYRKTKKWMKRFMKNYIS